MTTKERLEKCLALLENDKESAHQKMKNAPNDESYWYWLGQYAALVDPIAMMQALIRRG